MKLTQKAIDALKGDIRMRAKLVLALNKSEFRINDYIRANETNGDLTKAAAIQVIKEETGLTEDDILETEPDTVKA